MKQPAKNPFGNLDPRELVDLLGSSDFALAQAATEALFEKGVSALDALVEGLSHSNWRVRKNCAGLMDHLADDRCIEPLLRAMNDPIVGVRRLAIHSIGCQPCKLAPLQADIVGALIERATSDTSVRVRRVAVHMLGLQPYDARAVEALRVILDRETDPGLLSRARFAFEEHRRKAGEDLVSSCAARREGRVRETAQ